jgi:predicted nucleotidyltransferase
MKPLASLSSPIGKRAVRPRKIATLVWRDLRAELKDDVLGLLLAGSQAYGNPNEYSDIDLQAVIRPNWVQRLYFYVDETPVDLALRPQEEIRREFGRRDSRHVLSMFANGIVLYDRGGVVAQLVSEAKVLIEEPMPPLHEAEKLALVNDAFRLLKRAVDSARLNDVVAARHALCLSLMDIVAIDLRLKRFWPGQPIHQIVALGSIDPELHSLVERFR